METKECAIPYCDNEGDQLVPICQVPHYLHRGCLRAIFKSEPNPRCPYCRDSYLSELKELALADSSVRQSVSAPARTELHMPQPMRFINPNRR